MRKGGLYCGSMITISASPLCHGLLKETAVWDRKRRGEEGFSEGDIMWLGL